MDALDLHTHMLPAALVTSWDAESRDHVAALTLLDWGEDSRQRVKVTRR